MGADRQGGILTLKFGEMLPLVQERHLINLAQGLIHDCATGSP